jgi:hypothetical protein
MSKLVHVSFHGDTLDCIRHDDGEAYVVIKRVCENLGITDQAQATKLRGAPWATTTMIVVVGNDGKSREMLCLRIDSVPMWLAGINPKKVGDDLLRHKLEVYQAECAKVLWDHFGGHGGSLVQVTEQLERICLVLEERQERGLAQIRQEIDERFRAHELAIETRLQEQLPLAFHNAPAGPAYVDRAQQAELKGLIKAASERQGVSFQKVQGRLRAHLGVSGYRYVRNEQYPKALTLLQGEAARERKSPEQHSFDIVMGIN